MARAHSGNRTSQAGPPKASSNERDLTGAERRRAAGWRLIDARATPFWHRDTGRLALIGLAAPTLGAARVAIGGPARIPRAGAIALPSLLSQRSRLEQRLAATYAIRAVCCGVPLVLLALADPYSALVKDDVSYPGRRISLMIDASTA